MIQFDEFKEFVEELCSEIAVISKSFFNSDIEIEYKGDNSPVTVADKEIEIFIRTSIERRFNGDAIIGEEYGNSSNVSSRSTWVIDPIDGTYSFIHGIPLFTTLIAYCYDNMPIYGMIYQPISNELVVGGTACGTFYNSQAVKLRTNEKIEQATLLTTSITNIERLHNGGNFKELSLSAKTVRTWGDGYGYLMLVSGRGDVMIDPKVKFWDLAAIIPIINGAGGVITDIKGDAPEKGNSIVASTNQKLHNYIIDVLNKS